MIIDRHPGKPGKVTQERYIGYWAESEDWSVCGYFNKNIFLPWPGDFIDTNWDQQERIIVADYLDEASNVEFWRGYPFCRLGCKEVNLGTTDRGDGVYIWPSGFSHYLRVHGVKPPEEFIKHVLRKKGLYVP